MKQRANMIMTREYVESATKSLAGTATRAFVLAHDAALRARLAEVEQEVQHYREAVRECGATDGHSLVLNYRELRAQLQEVEKERDAFRRHVEAVDRALGLSWAESKPHVVYIHELKATLARLREVLKEVVALPNEERWTGYDNVNDLLRDLKEAVKQLAAQAEEGASHEAGGNHNAS